MSLKFPWGLAGRLAGTGLDWGGGYRRIISGESRWRWWLGEKPPEVAEPGAGGARGRGKARVGPSDA